MPAYRKKSNFLKKSASGLAAYPSFIKTEYIFSMLISILIFAFSIIGMFLFLFLRPTLAVGGHRFETFFLAPLLGAIIVLAFGFVNYSDLWSAFTNMGTTNPWEIIVIFLSMSFLSIALDEAGFFSFLASFAASKAKNSQITLFLILYALVSGLTIFTSNDIVILSFTPFIIFFAKRANVKATPYLVSEFAAANTWSMLLIIGNPTNIYLGENAGITFFGYISEMWLASLLSGLVCLAVLLAFFRRDLKTPIVYVDGAITLKDKLLAIPSLVFLLTTIVLMALSDFIGWPLYLISLGGALIELLYLVFCSLFRKDGGKALKASVARPSYSVIPFILSMLVLVYSLKWGGVTSFIANWLESQNPYLGVGLTSFFAASLINNIPMSVCYSELFAEMSAFSPSMVYLAIISSNVGAYLTPIGALAGLMFFGILKNYDVKFSIKDFFRYLTPLSLLSLGAAFLGFYLIHI